MATKLRSFSTHKLTKAAAWLLALVFLVLLVSSFYDLAYDGHRYNLEPEALLTPDYEASNSYYYWLQSLLFSLSRMANDAPDAHGQYLTDQGVLYRLQRGGDLYTNAPGYSAQDLTPESGRWMAVENGELTLHLEREDQLEPYDFHFYSSSYGYYDEYGAWVEDSGFADPDAPLSAQIFIPAETLNGLKAGWEFSCTTLRSDLGLVLWFALPLFLLTVFLCVVAGRAPGDRELHPGRLDRWWSELLLLGLIVMAFIGSSVAFASIEESLYWARGPWSNRSLIIWLCALGFGGGYCLAMPFLLAIVRKAKAGRFFRHSACASLMRLLKRFLRGCLSFFRGVSNFFRGLFDGSAYRKYYFVSAMFRRRLAYICGSLVCVLLFLFGLVTTPLFSFLACGFEILITWWYLRADNRVFGDMAALMDQIAHIAGGDLGWTPDVDAGSPLAPASRQLSEIGGGMQKSVEKQMQSERMKVELVTNVSHDLKTPLTSIISYVELLSKEDLPPEARDYVAILAQKSDRLKSLVYDLFELAKSTSGSMEIQSEALDFHRLIEQTLAEMQERIEQSGLAVRVALAAPPVSIWADGRKMYRVLQNIVDNALKYSMTGTRVFVDLSVLGSRAVLTVKNTAGYEMDFTAEEITERFVRGDKARTAEGSGLGLSIAQSFTQACGGRFHVAIDGDQFKVHVSFDLYQRAPTPADSDEQQQ